jgi:predicted amidohydrolase YtcJ
MDSVKLFADGGLSGATAALSGTYRHQPVRGLARLTEEEIFSLGLEAQRAGFRVCTHAIGDAAIDVVLSAYERLHERGGRGHRLEHFGLPDRAQIERARRLGAMAAPQTVFLHALGMNFRRYLNDHYLARTYPIRSMLRGGLTVALGSDAPVVPDDRPLLGIQAAVTRKDREGVPIAPDEAISVEDALYAYTVGGAIASGDEPIAEVWPGKVGGFRGARNRSRSKPTIDRRRRSHLRCRTQPSRRERRRKARPRHKRDPTTDRAPSTTGHCLTKLLS